MKPQAYPSLLLGTILLLLLLAPVFADVPPGPGPRPPGPGQNATPVGPTPGPIMDPNLVLFIIAGAVIVTVIIAIIAGIVIWKMTHKPKDGSKTPEPGKKTETSKKTGRK